MLANILKAAGYHVGLYTSPHLIRINERIRVNGVEITDTDFAETFAAIHATIEELLATGELPAHPTYFECVTAMAFEFFARAKTDINVFEVGMGGRLDSTNIIAPEVAVITQIAFDHESFLGHSIKEIAGEKAGIIKPGALVVNVAGNPIADQVIAQRASDVNAQVFKPDNLYKIHDMEVEDGCCRFTAESVSEFSSSDVYRSVKVALPVAGEFQVRNALTAMTAATLLRGRGFAINGDAISRGLSSVHWPGRLERVHQRPAVYFDGTHNPAGASELLAFWTSHFAGRRIHLIYGAMRDKAIDEIAGILFGHAETVLLTQSPQPRSISAATLAEMTRHLARHSEIVSDPSAALERALDLAAPEDIVFCTGSLYLVGDLQRFWHERNLCNTRV